MDALSIWSKLFLWESPFSNIGSQSCLTRIEVLFSPLNHLHFVIYTNIYMWLVIQVDETGLEQKDIELVMQQSNASRSKVHTYHVQ